MNVPTPEEAAEEMDAVVPGWRDMLPDVVWQRVLEHVDDLLDQANDLQAAARRAKIAYRKTVGE